MRIFKLILCFTLLCNLISFSQNEKIDSLKNALFSYEQKYVNKKDTAYVDLVNLFIQESIYSSSTDSLLSLSNRAQRVSEEIGYTKGKINTLYTQARIYAQKGDYTTPLNLAQSALELSNEINHPLGVIQSLKTLGLIFDLRADYARGIKYYFKALEKAEELNSLPDIADILQNISAIYAALGKHEEARKFIDKAIQINQQSGDKTGLSFNLRTLGSILEIIGDTTNALAKYQESLRLCQQSNNQIGVNRAKNSIANVQLQNKQYINALILFKETYNAYKSKKDKLGMAWSGLGITESYLGLKQYKMALRQALIDTLLLHKSTNKLLKVNAYHLLALAYQATNNFKEALTSYQLYWIVKDSIENKDNEIKLTQLKAQYEYTVKENLLKEEQAKKDILTNRERRFKNTIIIIICIMLVFVGFSAYRLFTQKKHVTMLNEDLKGRQEEILSQQEEIQTQNEELLKSEQLILATNKELIDKNELIHLQHTQLQGYSKNLENLISERTDKLVAANKEIGLFLYRASHDFKGPLATITGLLNLIKTTYEGKSIEPIVIEIESTIKKMSGMLSKLKAVGELDMAASRTVVSISDQLTSLVRFTEKNWPTKKILWHLPSHEIKPFYTHGDLLLLSLECLVENAIQFAKQEQPVIEIQTSQTSTHMVIKVIDYGVGMQQEILPFVFDMFFRGHDYAKGNGLGLYLVKKICEKMNWQVTIESQENEFTLCQLTIPTD